MNLQSIINSPGMWLVSSVMVIAVVAQSLLYMREAFKAADEQNIPRSECIKGLRSAMITAIGPSLGPVVIMMALIAVLGAPTTWMRLNDIGASRTELAMATISAKVAGVGLRSADFDIRAFSYVVWGMALNNFGWMAVALVSINRMHKAIKVLNEKSNPQWVKLFMGGAVIGLFAYLLSAPLVQGGGNIIAAAVSFISMFAISKFLGKYQRLQEPALGIAMLVGMFAAAAIYA